jgi:N-acetylneuraminic acid mutarotase
MSTARDRLAAAAGPDGRIYAIGGGFGANGGNLNTVEAYKPSTNSWATLTSMPTARRDLAAATGPDGRIYALGGSAGTGPLNTVEAYTPGTNSWATVASMLTARDRLAAATGSDGRIYALGGSNGTSPVNTMEAYTPGTNRWAAVASMPTAREYLAAATGPDGRIYAIGGDIGPDAAGNPNVVKTVEAYTPSTNRWATVASMPTVRDYLAAATGLDGRIYAIGGDTGTDVVSGDPIVVNTVGAYTPEANSWATVAPMPTGRHEIAAATGPDGRIYAIGGDIGGDVVLTTVEAYHAV